ncbi:putative dual specificity protein phosphatase [Trypanosoma rangeli]|uniref:Putative dual specificity protein phosphatase n=1 Tax=Trypanosoma rangeli TaxID=5698 RepID=A0A422NJU0_TRYRA|nr:putative dual specificity protein phosphatase [Trypanosoma rangeli]RNF05731.1 putative dual specificity protein phosphatase [Trypanosoma rangeli]|eukprot:RNF05731.1 putative dual specificity protein phosphatase [Trypanosoma rangeli]
MGNTVCTDAVPLSLEDVLHSCPKSPTRCVAEVLSDSVIEKFTRYQHNFKAFVVCEGATGAAVRRVDPSQLSAQPFDLSQAKIKLEETAAYILLHVQCTPIATAGSDTLIPRGEEQSHRELDGTQNSSEEAPSWSRILTEVFTPRGLATAFATNIGKPSLFLPPSVSLTGGVISPTTVLHSAAASSRLDGLDFRFSIHILTGKKAHQLVASVALLHALRIEQSLMESDESVRRLFFNYRPSHGTLDIKTGFSACVPIGEVVSYRIFSHRSPIIEETRKNAILRILHGIHGKSFPAILATPSSACVSFSRCSTPRGVFTTTTTSYSAHTQAFMSSLASVTPLYSHRNSGLDIPRLRFAAGAARRSAVDLPRSAPPQYGSTMTPPWTQHEGASAGSNASSTRTPRAFATPPIFPVISSLRLNEALNGRATAEVNTEGDEIRMTEERMQKLKAAAPEATEVLPWLFVGGEEAAGDRGQLLSKGITNIVNTVAFSVGNVHSDVFQYLGLYLSDSPDEPIFSLFPIVIRFVEETRLKGGKTFIHCHQGVSRSCSFVIAYVMWHQGLCYDRAFEFVRARRNVCSPNTGFYVNLLLWEKQMVAPIFNKVYAYVPYTEYMFPFSFRLALTFRPHENTHNNDDDSHVVNFLARVVHHTDESYTMDPRLSYGILLGERLPQSGSPVTPIFSYFFAGSDCNAIVQQEAKEDWNAFLRYNFYQGQRRRSTNNKGEIVTYAPIPPIGQATECLQSIQDVEDVIQEQVFNRKCAASSGVRFPRLVLAQIECWDKLLAHENMMDRLSNHLSEQQHVKVTSLKRKRIREEERRCLSNVLPAGGTPRISSNKSAGARSNTMATPTAPTSAVVAGAAAVDSASSATPLSTPPLVTTTTTKSAATDGRAAVSHVRTYSAPHTARSKPLGGEVEIYAYPFTDSPLTNILDIADMEPDGCYVVLVPANAAAATALGHHHVFLWFGCNSSVTETEAWEAYERSLKIDKGVRLWNETVLESPLEEVVRDGEEPDDLILALE